jgi:hypothetical protein
VASGVTWRLEWSVVAYGTSSPKSLLFIKNLLFIIIIFLYAYVVHVAFWASKSPSVVGLVPIQPPVVITAGPDPGAVTVIVSKTHLRRTAVAESCSGVSKICVQAYLARSSREWVRYNGVFAGWRRCSYYYCHSPQQLPAVHFF